MGCGNSTPDDTEYQKQASGKLLQEPTFKGERVALFNGLLYRIMDNKSGKWGFFSNTRDYEFRVRYLFGLDSDIQPMGDAKLIREDDGFLVEMQLYPLETKMFIQGSIEGFESKLEALPLSEEYFAQHPEVDERAYMKRLELPKAAHF